MFIVPLAKGVKPMEDVVEAHSLELKQHISQLPDDELLEMATTKSGEYREEAVNFAKAELTSRGIDFETPATVDEGGESDGTILPFLESHGAVCPTCRGPLRYGTLVGEKELTVVFADNYEERFIRVSACSQCGQLSLMVDYETNVQQ